MPVDAHVVAVVQNVTVQRRVKGHVAQVIDRPLIAGLAILCAAIPMPDPHLVSGPDLR